MVKIVESNSNAVKKVRPNDIVTVKLYGNDSEDDFKKYRSNARYFVTVLTKSYLKARNFSINYDIDRYKGSWEVTVTGKAKVIYTIVNHRVRGYDFDSLQEFIDQYKV